MFKRERCPVISKSEEKQLIKLLSRTSPIEVKQRDQQELKLYKKISKYNPKALKIFDPSVGNTVTRLTIEGRIVPCKEEIRRCVSYYYRKTNCDGAKKIYHLAKEQFYGIGEPIIQRILNSRQDQHKKVPLFKNKAPLRPVTASAPMERHQVDLVDLRSSSVMIENTKYLYVVSVLDVFSRFLWLRAIPDKTPATVAKTLSAHYVEFGPPKYIQCDQGSEFKGVFKDFCETLGIKLIFSSSSHPQSQGKIERSHQQWKDKIRNKIVGTLETDEPYNWVDELPLLQTTYNEGFHRAIGMTPYECMFGHKSYRQQQLSKERQDSVENQVQNDDGHQNSNIETHIDFIKQLRTKALAKSTKASQKMVTRGLAISPPTEYEVGEHVYVKYKGKGKRLKRGFEISAPKVNLGTIIEAKPDKYKYKIQLKDSKKANMNVVSTVDQITSVTRELENQRRSMMPNQNRKCHCPKSKCSYQVKSECSNTMSIQCCPIYGKYACLYHIALIDDFLRKTTLMEKHQSGSEPENSYDNLIRNALELGLLERGSTPADGNCMFHCLALQLSDILNRRMSHDTVRKEVVDYLRRNPFTQDGTHLRSFLSDSDWEGYLLQMENGAWGDHLVLHAASNLYSIGIMVVSSLGEDATQFLHSTSGIDLNDQHLVLLGHLSEHHYISLEPFPAPVEDGAIAQETENEEMAEPLRTSSSSRGTVEIESVNIYLRQEIERERIDFDDNTINLLNEGRRQGVPVALDNARVYMFINEMKRRGKTYGVVDTCRGPFIFVSEDDMELFDNRAEYMDTELSFRLQNDCLRYWCENCLNDDEMSSVTDLNDNIVSIPQNLSNQYDTWLDQLKLNLKISMF